MKAFLKTLKKRLTNLSSSNKALFHQRIIKSQDVDFSEFDYVNSENAFDSLSKIVAGQKVKICRDNDSRDAQNNVLSKQLKNIQRNYNSIYEERGTQELFMAWPFMEGKFHDDTPLRAPLIFFPVELSHTQDEWSLKRKKDIAVTFNVNAFLALQHFNELKISDEFLEQNLADLGKDVQVFMTRLYDVLKQGNIDFNFNRELFESRLQKFVALNRKDLDAQYKTGQLKLMPYAVLGLYPQANSYLVPDYDTMLKQDLYKNIEDLFLSKVLTYPNDRSKEEYTFTPFSIDASQEEVIKNIKRGASQVVQGPPGSGKSQLICNLVSDFLARGKSVLVVSQKRVALDVVYNRLKEVELDRFSALVHDIKADRNKLYEQVAGQIKAVDGYHQLNNNLDTVKDEREFLRASRTIDQILEELDEFKKALFDDSEAGISIKDLYLSSNAKAKTINLNEYYHFFTTDIKNHFVGFLERYFEYVQEVCVKDHPWKKRLHFNNFGFNEEQRLKEIVHDVPEFVHRFKTDAKNLLGFELEFEDAWWVLKRKEDLEEFLQLIKSKIIHQYFKHFLNHPGIDDEWLLLKERQILDCLRDEGIETSLKQDELVAFQTAIENYLAIYKNPYKRLRWRLFSKEKYLLKKVFVANNLTWNKDNLMLLRRKLDNRMNFEHNITELKNCSWLVDYPVTKEAATIQKWFDIQHTAVHAVQSANDFRSFKQMLNLFQNSFEETQMKVQGILTLCNQAEGKKLEWGQWLSAYQIDELSKKPEKEKDYLSFLEEKFETLAEWDTVAMQLEAKQLKVLNLLIDELGDVSINEYKELFVNSIHLHWIAHLEKKYPVLKIVSTPKMGQLQKELVQQIETKYELSKEIMLMKVREQTYDGLEYNRLKNRITYRELQHQATKKKRIWPIRKTIHEFTDELFKIVPCWLCSPESVSALFPLMPVFDLVIFDEASQCFLEKGLPSMYRAKQIAVCGDEQQLQPNDLYKIRWDEETEDNMDLEIDSLLDFSSKHLAQTMLTGHYRSQYPELIQFSNAHFYEGKLQYLPSKKNVLEQSDALHYEFVQGVWENGSNEVEAIAVAKQVHKLVKEGVSDIGVVTFNFKQQQLIQDKLDLVFADAELVYPERLFIKNIENVQGDERDVIIFSVGYAPSLSGKFSMNFGLLNQENGHHRLNVAITRAKQSIIVIASILPHQLLVDDSLHEGPRLFKKYLQYVYEHSNHTINALHLKEETQARYVSLKSKLVQEEHLETSQIKDNYFFSDLVCEHNGLPNKLVMTDDELFYEEKSMKSSLAYKRMKLDNLGWQVHQTYSRRYWKHKENCLEDILRFYHQ